MSSWVTSPLQFAKVITGDHKKLVSEKAIRILAALINITPKDTGMAAAGWIATIGAPSAATSTSTNFSARVDEAKALFTPAGLPAFPVLFLSNNVKYIGVLNYGRPPGTRHSLKAPLLFVERAIDAESAK